jgi:uncharacterized protein with HEPN domain
VPSSDPAQRFQDIIDNIARIERFTEGLNLERFIENEEKLFAVQHALLILSEAAVKLGELATELCLMLTGGTFAASETACDMNTTL